MVTFERVEPCNYPYTSHQCYRCEFKPNSCRLSIRSSYIFLGSVKHQSNTFKKKSKRVAWCGRVVYFTCGQQPINSVRFRGVCFGESTLGVGGVFTCSRHDMAVHYSRSINLHECYVNLQSFIESLYQYDVYRLPKHLISHSSGQKFNLFRKSEVVPNYDL